MTKSLVHQIALTLIPGIGCVQARNLLEYFDVDEIFQAKKSDLKLVKGLGEVRIKNILNFKDFATAEKEVAFIEKYKIQPLFIKHNAYPQRLLHCYDAPILLYYKGQADLNHSKIVSIVGSRNHTDYGKMMTEALIEKLTNAEVLVVSGLAYGIDSIAHKACLKNNMVTVGVLAHGLDKIYPPHHTDMAKQMTKDGGLLTEFRKGTQPDKYNFPSRNRIVAGISDATIVIETDMKGGSMITAEVANSYNKEVFAFPGKTTDKKSAGCNYLIKSNKAILLTDAQQLIETMGWTNNKKPYIKKNRELFLNLTEDEKMIVELLNNSGSASIDEINTKTNLSSSSVAAAILNLEIHHVIEAMPGKMYKII